MRALTGQEGQEGFYLAVPNDIDLEKNHEPWGFMVVDFGLIRRQETCSTRHCQVCPETDELLDLFPLFVDVDAVFDVTLVEQPQLDIKCSIVALL